jgi:hypothetical protein
MTPDQVFGRPMGTFDASAFVKQWDQVRAMAQLVDSVDKKGPGQDLTARRFDEAQPAGHRPYMVASGYIAAAVEHVEVLREMVLNQHLTPRAPWTLLRSVFEAGFWSTWVLEPDDGLERRRRGLRVEVRGMAERTAFYDSLLMYDPQKRAEVATGHAEHERSYRAEAEQLDLPWKHAKNRIVLFDELKKLREVSEMEPGVRAATYAMWRSLSGLQHGYPYAVMLHSQIHNMKAITGGERATITINESHFLAAATAAHSLLVSGMNRYIRLSTRVT